MKRQLLWHQKREIIFTQNLFVSLLTSLLLMSYDGMKTVLHQLFDSVPQQVGQLVFLNLPQSTRCLHEQVDRALQTEL